MRPRHLGVALALLVMSCSPTAGDSTTESSTVTVSPPASLDPTSVSDSERPCAVDGYTSRGPIGTTGSDAGDTGQILAIGSETIGECERVTIELATRGGAPATELTPTRVEILEAADIVRVSFDTRLQTSGLADSTLEGWLTDRAYVVRGLDGQLFIDIMMLAPVEVAMIPEETPARLHLELRPGPDREVVRAAASADVVVMTPSAGNVQFPLIVRGYSRTGSGSVRAELLPSRGDPVERTTTAAAYVETWGAFELRFEDQLEGQMELVVAGQQPGDTEGVTLQLRAR